jgi:predicted RNase H-like HicB family nuclease
MTKAQILQGCEDARQTLEGLDSLSDTLHEAMEDLNEELTPLWAVVQALRDRGQDGAVPMLEEVCKAGPALQAVLDALDQTRTAMEELDLVEEELEQEDEDEEKDDA